MATGFLKALEDLWDRARAEVNKQLAQTGPATTVYVTGHSKGGGIAPLQGEESGTCELRKMYFLPELRGFGAGGELISLCLEHARRLGYKRCYLETLTGMDSAQKLYEKHGFERIPSALGRTGHFGCNRFYLRPLGA